MYIYISYHDIVDDGRCVPSDSPISPATACNNQTDLVLSGGLRQPVAGMDAGTPRLVNLLQHSTTVCLSFVFDPLHSWILDTPKQRYPL